MPTIQPIFENIQAMYVVSRADPLCTNLWWDWWGSYVVFGGPGGRWVIGIALGYWIANHENPINPHHCQYGLPLMQPTMSVAVTLLVALSLAGFCTVGPNCRVMLQGQADSYLRSSLYKWYFVC